MWSTRARTQEKPYGFVRFFPLLRSILVPNVLRPKVTCTVSVMTVCRVYYIQKATMPPEQVDNESVTPSSTGLASSSSSSMASAQCNFHYVTPRGAQRLAKYQYSGSDASLLYKLVISPSAQWLVDHLLPSWMAPNTITTFGLLLVIWSHLLLLFFAPNFETEAPRWCYALCGVMLLTYQILDVADGKQARKTNTSSPLGLFFDHGCDALNCVVSSMVFSSVVTGGRTLVSLSLLVFPSLVFFMATWEEYWTGALDLPLINGPNEGLAIMYGIYFVTACLGPAIWHQPNPVITSLENIEVFALSTAMSAILQSFLSVVLTSRSLTKQGKAHQVFGAVSSLLPMFLLYTLASGWVLYSPTDVFHAHPRLMLWTFGLQFCKMAMRLMLAHMMEEPYRLFSKTFLTQVFGGLLLVTGIVPWYYEKMVVEVLFVITVVAYIHMVYYVIVELAQVLDIPVFTIDSTPKSNDKKIQ